ncbi:hypothetical protein DSCO28_23700 [Desulfosarcina ovata subsp. sediminis]|uniref:Uncharacterized protein n=1 Tax=Desulfosarcina ovata subsp. sediminis TaxID=885957 RepID=A0A5K7ZK99_9BACT|nr:hypothetical protein DSCO28_23700 [Desulfosarcina ovata subsp. sediminis]
MPDFGHTTAKIAAWNLAGYGGIPEERINRQVEGFLLLDAEVVALVAINPLSVLNRSMFLSPGRAQPSVWKWLW